MVVVGMRGIRVLPESKERDRLSFAFMTNGISSERQVETAVRQGGEVGVDAQTVINAPVVITSTEFEPAVAELRTQPIQAPPDITASFWRTGRTPFSPDSSIRATFILYCLDIFSIAALPIKKSLSSFTAQP